MELLIVVLVLAVSFVAFAGVIAQALKVSSRWIGTTDAVSAAEPLFFQIESGLRPDLAGYGGTGKLPGGYHYRIEAEEGRAADTLLEGRLDREEGGSLFEFRVRVFKAPIE